MRKRLLRKRRGFTLLQILATTAIIVLLAGISFGYLQRSRRAAQRTSCDVHLKTLTLALDAFRQEHGAYPLTLAELTRQNYITDPETMRCPLDPRTDGSYEEFYIFRGARPVAGDNRDQSTLPLIVCPFHEEDGGHGAQALRSGTRQYAAMTATLTESTGATVERPGKKPFLGRNGMKLYGGDRISTESGSAKILFADGSYAELTRNSDVTVLQSFIAGQQNAPLYTILRQRLGEISYRVNPGSKFDVVTPTATAGALGTKFAIKCNGDKWYLKVTESHVLCNKEDGSQIYAANMSLNGPGNGWNLIGEEDSRGGGHGGHGDDDDDDDDDSQ
jgi:competence protein ComGC